MHILLSLLGAYFECRLSRHEVFIHLLLGSKTLLLVEKEFLDTFKCAECGTEVESDGQLLNLCDDHRESFIEHWYNRWMSKK